MIQTTHEIGELAGELMTLLVFKRDTATVEDFCKAVTKHWTAFAKTLERTVWEEAAQILKDHYWDSCSGHGTFLLEQFRLHAALAEGRNSHHAV